MNIRDSYKGSIARVGYAKGDPWQELDYLFSQLSHAGYLGVELAKAETAGGILFGFTGAKLPWYHHGKPNLRPGHQKEH